MKNKVIKIKCISNDSLGSNDYKIKIYNNKMELIFDSFTDKFGCAYFDVQCFGIFKIMVFNFKSFMQKQCIVSFINKDFPNELLIVFDKICTKKQNDIVVNLTDENYKGLPITEGRMVLWTVNK